MHTWHEIRVCIEQLNIAIATLTTGTNGAAFVPDAMYVTPKKAAKNSNKKLNATTAMELSRLLSRKDFVNYIKL